MQCLSERHLQLLIMQDIHYSYNLSLSFVFVWFSPEFIQTEMHNVRTLKILLHVYMYELKLCPILDEARLERLFYGLESMLKLHQHFLNCLKSRQSTSQEDGSANMYPLAEFADILVSQVRPAGTGKYETRCKLHTNVPYMKIEWLVKECLSF